MKTLPIYKRAMYDTARDGAYAIGGLLLASGSLDLVIVFLQSGEFSQSALRNLALGIIMACLGYLQALEKEKRKQNEQNT